MSEKDGFLTVPEAAKLCGVSRATMWNWVKSDKVKAFTTMGGHHRILKSHMDQLLQEIGLRPEGASPGGSILIVDDDPSVRRMLKQRLENLNYQVETASDGFQVGIIVQKFKPDLIILDLCMAGLDGFQVCRTIKQDPELRRIRILSLTGFDIPENKSRILQEGADGYIAKTADFSEVLAQIRILLS
jgi:excisionase family DNA binding protein